MSLANLKWCKGCSKALDKNRDNFYYSGNQIQALCKKCHAKETKKKLYERRKTK